MAVLAEELCTPYCFNLLFRSSRQYGTENDVVGGFEKFRGGLQDVLYEVCKADPTSFFRLSEKSEKNESKKTALIVAPPVADANDSLL